MPAQPEEGGEQATQGLPLLPPPPPPPPSAPEPEPAAHRPHSHRRTGQTVYHTSAVYGAAPEPRPVKRRTMAVTVTAGVLAALVVALVLTLTVF
ncbi:MAG: hypothetical protein QOG28_3539, partial [Trebonia sp.]|nr:hypothetical protein [Trebonia sp.]